MSKLESVRDAVQTATLIESELAKRIGKDTLPGEFERLYRAAVAIYCAKEQSIATINAAITHGRS